LKDYLVRIITRKGNIRALACVTTQTVQEACRIHGIWPTAAAALGRALTGGVLMGALLKSGQRTALSGPLKKIIVEADSNGAVRGLVGVPETDLPPKNGKFDVAGAIGRAGFLTVTKDLGMKEPYRGVVQLYTSEIAEDLAWYFTESEQIPSAVGLGTYISPEEGVSASGGFLVQSLPPSDEAAIERLMAQLQTLPPVTEMIRDGKTPEDMLALIFRDIEYDVLEKRVVDWQCSCSRERMERALISLGAEELEKLMAEQDTTDMACEFCRSVRQFEKADLMRLAAEIRNGHAEAGL